MEIKLRWIKYLSPFIGILFCPITILFVWAIWTGPVDNSETDFVEDVRS